MASIIFDFDGTLADTFPMIVDVCYELTPGVQRKPQAQLERLRRLPLLRALLHLGIPWVRVPRLIRFTRKKLTSSMGRVPPFAGVPQMLRSLRESGHQVFILSSNYPKNGRQFLQHHNLSQYVTAVRGVRWGNVLLKSLALRNLVRAYKLDPASCYHVGNEALDMRAARHAGMRGIAVTWSGFERQALVAAKPFAVVDRPAEVVKIAGDHGA